MSKKTKSKKSRSTRALAPAAIPRKRRTGRPQFAITPKILEDVEGYAARGLTKDQIAWALGINPCTLYDKQNKYPELELALERGKATGVAIVANAHFIAATAQNNIAAQQFFLRTRGGFHEVQKTELTGKDGGPIEVQDAELSSAREKVLSLLTVRAARASKSEDNL